MAGANFAFSSLASSQLYSTANYQAKNLHGIGLYSINMTGWSFAGQNLTGAALSGGTLTGADFTGAIVAGANFSGTTLTSSQLYSTASYQTKNLQGIGLQDDNLTGWNFAGQNLTGADFYTAMLTNANFTGADLRGTANFTAGSATTTNSIFPDGRIHGLQLNSTNPTLLVRNYIPTNGNPIPILIFTQMSIDSNATLQFQLDGGTWGSTISFHANITVTLGGNLELGLAPGVDPSSLVHDTFQLFNWAGVSPSGQFDEIVNDLPTGYWWDTSALYTAGDVILVPEPSMLSLLASEQVAWRPTPGGGRGPAGLSAIEGYGWAWFTS